ncbi:MAG: Gfo/Idh/MocA family oxidoreductase [Clostridia bacterium]
MDAIVAIQPYRHHLAILPDIIQAGKAILTEKPLALSVEAGEKLGSVIERERYPAYGRLS